MFKDVVGYEGLYEVNESGVIRICKSGKVMKSNADKDGYLILKLGNKNKIRSTVGVHRVVAMAFIPNPENKPQVNHKDGVKNNNHVSNLEWVTRSENMVHAIESGLKRILKGEDCSHKFSDEVIEQMKKDATTKSYTQKEIAEKYNISQSHLSSILKGNYRGEGVSEKAIRKITGEKVHNATSTDEEIYQIKGMLANNVPRSVIAKQFNISKTKVQQIATGEYWGHIVHPNYTYVPKPKGMKFTKDDAKQVLILKEKGLTIRDISSKMNMSWSMVNNICGGKMWKEVKEEFEKERG